ncbi:MAG: putative transglutaminase family protein cysteine peptidase [Rhizobium sp.]|nr:putative transglutaminase family protein cysteine peptidase [Rhizobium sp.]
MTGIINKAGWTIASIVAGLFLGTNADAAARYMLVGAITSQPIGHYEFCQTHKAECSVKTANSVAPRVTEFGWNMVRQINAQVNHDIMPMTDEEIFGRDEVWAYPKDVGDCEDFALLKRRLLLQAGFSAADVLITVVRKPDGEGHAVLTLRTADGDYILDNLDNSVKLWSETPYRFLKRQASFNTGRWVTIENSDEVVVGAVEK